jgi:putative RNA 2'-phosphotransferase
MDTKRLIKVSKYLAKHLRHTPEALRLTLEPGGWVRVDDLLAACANRHFYISRAELNEVVAKNDKQRFAFDESGERIRANQGHSVEVDLQLEQIAPPDVLYHGTSRAVVGALYRDGIRKMSRHHVHLSAEVETAMKVGGRHGVPVVIRIDARRMHADGHVFYRSDNGVWLVESVPPEYFLQTSEDTDK